MTLMHVAFVAQLALAVATSPASCPAGTCAASELDSRDDAQVLLQNQKKLEITAENPKREKFGFNVNPPDFENSMSVTAVVKDGDDIKGDGDLLAFVGGVLQGVQSTPKVLPPHGLGGAYGGKAVYFLMTFGHGKNDKKQPDDGKEVTFKYLTKDGHLEDLKSAKKLTFKGDSPKGSAIDPVVLTVTQAAAAPPASKCADVSQTDLNTYLKTFGNGYDGLTCAQFKGWGNCNLMKGYCDKTCGVCK